MAPFHQYQLTLPPNFNLLEKMTKCYDNVVNVKQLSSGTGNWTEETTKFALKYD